MTRQGHIVRWDAARSFGFIATAEGARHIFFHVRDFRGDEPAEGMAVRFEQIEVGGKGPRAMSVMPMTTAARAGARQTPGPRPPTPPALGATRDAPRSLDGQPALFGGALLVWLGLLAAISVRRLWPLDLPVVVVGLLALNIATFVSYALDKSAAEQGRWRTPESTLHALAAAGGWPAAWLAQRALRHKSRKREFLVVYVLTVLLHLGALGAWLWRGLSTRWL
jgi:uncharacterized membrane protein YsdA (DUF1294 family)/cold shock CspA family protein